MDKTENKRNIEILTVTSIETLTAIEEGVELTEGYTYDVHGSIPQLADSIAKLAIEFDKEFGDGAGSAFLALMHQYYETNKEKGGNIQ